MIKTRPLLADKVGCNTCQKGDRHIGGGGEICQQGSVPYDQIGGKDKHFTCMDFTNLLGDPVLCVIIISRKEYTFQTDGGIDYDVTHVGDVEDEDCFEKNIGEGKFFLAA